LQTAKQRSSKLFYIVKMFENMYGDKNIKSKSFDFIYVHVIWYALGQNTLDVYCICNVIYILAYQIRKITYEWPIFFECWQNNILLPPLPIHEVALIDKAQDIDILLQKGSFVGLVEMGGIGRTPGPMAQATLVRMKLKKKYVIINRMQSTKIS